MEEKRVFLSPILSNDTAASGFSFVNKIGTEFLECRKMLSVRLLSLYSPIDMLPSRLYINGLRRKIFGEGLQDDFFTIPQLEGGKVCEYTHTKAGHLNIQGVHEWKVHFTSLAEIGKIPNISRYIVIELGVSYLKDNMNPDQYLPFVLNTENTTINLQTFQKIQPQASVGLIDISIPPLANVFPPFNYIKATTSSRRHSIETNLLGNKEISLELPADFYSTEDMWEQAYKFLTEVGCEVRKEGDRLLCHHRANNIITLHKRMVDFWDVQGDIERDYSDSVSFKATGLSFGRFDEVLPMPNPLIFECDMLQDTVVGSHPFRLLRMIFLDSAKGQHRHVQNHLFENIQMVPTFSRMVFRIAFNLLDYKGNEVYFAKGAKTLSGTLVIKDA